MQYSFTLPADYDMAIIRNRIVEKGRLMDGFEGLNFKAFLYAEQKSGYSRENLYAPFYLWNEVSGMRRFLSGKGFEALRDSFGWPAIGTFVPVETLGAANAKSAVWATRELFQIAPFSSLGMVEEKELDAVRTLVAKGAVTALSAYEPNSWSLLRLALWTSLDAAGTLVNPQVYRVGHVAQGLAGFGGEDRAHSSV